MPILRIEHPVPDFDAWKQAFDSDPLDRKRSGVRRYRILRSLDDPNYAIVDLEFDDADDAGEEPAAAPLGNDSAPREHEAEARGGRCQAHVHGEGQRRTHTDRGAVDRRDHGLAHREDAEREDAAAVARRGVLVPGPGFGGPERLRTFRDVGPGGEGAALTRDDDGAYLVVGVGAIERGEELAQRLRTKRVQPLRTAERDRGDVAGELV